MKIGLAHYSSSDDISGVTTWFEGFVTKLQENGHCPVVHLHHFGHDPGESRLAVELHRRNVRVVAANRGASLEENVHKTLAFLQTEQPQIFLPHCLDAHHFAARIAGANGLPWALTLHSDDPNYWRILNACEPWRNNGEIVAVSHHIAAEVKERHNIDAPVVIPYGVRLESTSARYNVRPFRVVYSGRIVEAQKRISLVLATAIESCRARRDIEFRILGGGVEMSAAESTVAKAGFTDRITFTGVLSPDEVRAELLMGQAILLMSDFEGLPVALLEAMSVGVVPVVRDIPSGIPELVRHQETGLLVDESPSTAAKAIYRLVSDQQLWTRCSVAARAVVAARFSEEAGFSKWIGQIGKLQRMSSINYPLRIPLGLSLPADVGAFDLGGSTPALQLRRLATRMRNWLGRDPSYR